MAKTKKKTKKTSLVALKEQRAAYLFLIPAFLGLSLITYGPLLAVFGVSLTDLNAFQIQGYSPNPVKFVGFQNFIDIFDKNQDIDFLNSIKVTVIYALLAVVASIIYSMFIAMLLNRKIPGRAFFRAIFYVPYILPATGTILSWSLLTRSPKGLFNNILTGLGLKSNLFLLGGDSVLPTLALIAVWGCGNLIVIFLAGLQDVPRTYMEAAEIDGASAWQRFWHITIPCMTPIIFYNLLMSLVTSLQVVVPALASTDGGPGQSSNFMTYAIYRTAFRYGQFGRAGTISVVFFIIAAILAFILFSTSKKWIFYEGGEKK